MAKHGEPALAVVQTERKNERERGGRIERRVGEDEEANER